MSENITTTVAAPKVEIDREFLSAVLDIAYGESGFDSYQCDWPGFVAIVATALETGVLPVPRVREPIKGDIGDFFGIITPTASPFMMGEKR